jgi:outer membrane protein
MRTLLCALGLFVALLWANPAHAQYESNSLGLSLGYMDFNRTSGLEGGFFVGFDASLYIGSGLEIDHAVEVVSLTKLTFPKDPSTGKRVIGLAPSLGLRYVIPMDSFRPFAGTDISYLLVFRESSTGQYVGLGPNVGFEYMFGDSVSMGLRGQYNFYIALNEKTQTSLTFGATAAAYF